MKKIFTNKILIAFFFCLGCIQHSYAQKNLKLVITSISANNTSGTNCDGGCIIGNNQIDWVWDIDD